MRVRVLPRETAAAVITSAVSAMGWAVAVAVILMTVPVLIETLAQRGRLDDLPVTLILLGAVLGGVAAVAIRPRRWVVLLYLGLGGLATMGYQVILLSGDPGIVDTSPYLVNRPSLALVLVGIPASRALVGIAWTGLGFVVAGVVGVGSFALADVPFQPGLGPVMVLALTAVVYLTLAAIQARIRARVPNFDELEAETRALAHGEDLSRRTTAIVHDTLLNDLAVVMNSPDRLDERARERLLADLDTLRGADWITASADAVVSPAEDAGIRNELARIASEFQWRGVSLHITGAGPATYIVTTAVADAMLAAVRASLENVARHSGATVAEVELISDDQHVTIMVTDRGKGFDPAAVPSDRLGLRSSVAERMAAVGGSARVWSAPGEGTSVIISAPISQGVGP
ncbi:ATP-binding protein [Pseudolysinimonas sp.]|uniref:sensor histidine kinase n=1 Tax=Pseudolysinimonas sp. TaxID=2680009 RepID=UPI00286BCAAD|nr:ATP-binding protein [Pseudolysinimonas sp.]